MYCSNCGSRMLEGATSCPWCGASLMPAGGAVVAALASTPAPAPGLAPASQPIAAPSLTTFDPTPYLSQPARGVTYAGFWTRFMAYLIDSFALGIGMFIVGLSLTVLAMLGGGSEQALNTMSVFTWFLGLAGSWLYFAWMESSKFQATLGKMAMGIVVTDTDGQRISFGRASGRHFAKYISSFLLAIGYIMAAFTERKQALHDMIAGTVVSRDR